MPKEEAYDRQVEEAHSLEEGDQDILEVELDVPYCFAACMGWEEPSIELAQEGLCLAEGQTVPNEAQHGEKLIESVRVEECVHQEDVKPRVGSYSTCCFDPY